ncbi:MAG: type II secretion system F family protein [Pseudonocardia sp.]
MVSLTGLCLAMALACLPGPAAPQRLHGLRDRTVRARHQRHLPTAAWVVAAGAAGFVAAGPGGMIAAALLVVVVRRRRHARSVDTAATVTSGEVAEALRRITDELRAGAHPAATLDGTRNDGVLAAAVLSDAAAAARLGDDVPRALRRVAAQRPEIAEDLQRIAGSWALAERHGVPLADLLERARSDIAWRVGYARRVRAQLAGPRATAVVLTVLPGLGLLLGQLLGADPIGVLRDGLVGQSLLVVGVGLATGGFTWCDRILCGAMRS